MTYSELINRTGKETGVPAGFARCVLDTAFSVMTDSLKNGESVTIKGFGSFSKAVRKGRTGVNISTGEHMTIPDSYTVKFHLSEILKDNIRD